MSTTPDMWRMVSDLLNSEKLPAPIRAAIAALAAGKAQVTQENNPASPDFWQRCVELDCIVVPVQVYTDWGPDGNLDPSKFVGVRYTAIEGDKVAVGPDYWFDIEEYPCGIERMCETPEAALTEYVARMEPIFEERKRRQAQYEQKNR